MLKKLFMIAMVAGIGIGCCNSALAQQAGKAAQSKSASAAKDTTAKKPNGPMSIEKFVNWFIINVCVITLSKKNRGVHYGFI